MPLQEPDASTLYSPWVLRAAWRKTQSWLSQGIWADPAELLAWQADPWRHLSKLASELRFGEYAPEAFPMVPYPKKGDHTRHYCQPSVRDQVAFAAWMVLLGPFLEARMPNFSFGNRLFRPRVRVPGDAGYGRWERAPFSLNQARVYDNFSVGYGHCGCK